MAFNPFHSFRKHQKVVFSGLTIICMLTFVMAGGVGGGGDFISEVQRFLGGRSPYPEVASVYGKRIDNQEMMRLRQNRELANTYMRYAVGFARNNVMADIEKNIPEFDELYKNQLKQLDTPRQMASMAKSYSLKTEIGQMLQGYLQQFESQVESFDRQLIILQERLQTAKKPEEAENIALLRAFLRRDVREVQQSDELYPGSGFYFGGSPSVEGLVDFMIWQKQADRLGIELSPEDIGKAVARETNHKLTEDQKVFIEQNVLHLDRRSGKTFLAALGEEFRVRLAQDALAGYDPTGYIEPPASVTPAELWDYYLKNRTEVTVDVLPVPVEQFISKVTEKPSDPELHELFEKYKDDEYTPESETPGFKLSRRVRIEWVEATASSKHYRIAGKQALFGLACGTPGSPWLALALSDAFFRQYDRTRYEFDNARWNYYQMPPLASTGIPEAFYTFAYLNRPESAASIMGLLQGALLAGPFGGSLPDNNLLGIFSAVQANAALREQKNLAPAIANENRRRIPLAVAMFGSGGTVRPALAFAAIYEYAQKATQFLPLDAVQPQITAKLIAGLSSELVGNDLKKFKTELADAKNQTQAFVKKEVERHGWKYGATTELRNQYDVAKDPGLDPLKEAYPGKDRLDDPSAMRDFANLMFRDQDPKASLFKPQELGGRGLPGETETFYYWKSADLPAQTLTFDAARPAVEHAWRLAKARPLAKADAEKIAEKARAAQGVDAFKNLNDAALALKEKVIRLAGMAKLKSSPVARAGLQGRYDPYRGYLDKLPYARTDFVDQVLSDLKQPGDVAVLSDRPESSYYVVALSARDLPTKREFQQGSLLARLEADRRLQYREHVRERLRDEAQVKIVEKMKLELDKPSGSSEE